MAAIPQVIAVTGASRGIGAAIVEELAARGHTVGCLSRKGQGPEDHEASAALRERGRFIACDVLDESSIRDALARLNAEAGAIDGLVNNAGLYLEGPSDRFSTADFERVMATNCTGPFIACREAYPYLVAAGGGTIVNLGSFFGELGTRNSAAYATSKAAIAGLTRCLAVEWAREKIRVLNVAPGFIATDLNKRHMENRRFREFLNSRIPTGAPGEPAEVARLIAMLFAERLPFLTGATITMDGAQTINQ